MTSPVFEENVTNVEVVGVGKGKARTKKRCQTGDRRAKRTSKLSNSPPFTMGKDINVENGTGRTKAVREAFLRGRKLQGNIERGGERLACCPGTGDWTS